MQSGVGYALRQRHLQAPKINATWYPVLASFHAPNKIQPGEQSMGGGQDGIGYKTSWTNPNGNANFPYVNSNGNSNFNWTDNDFNGDWRWLVEVSNCIYSPRCAGFLFMSTCFCQPPSIFPASSRRADN